MVPDNSHESIPKPMHSLAGYRENTDVKYKLCRIRSFRVERIPDRLCQGIVPLPMHRSDSNSSTD